MTTKTTAILVTASLVLFMLLAGPSSLGAQSAQLSAAKTARCVFTLYTVGTWDGAAPRVEVKQAALSLTFTSINLEDGTAEQTDAVGTTPIIAKLSTWSLHLLQMSSEGALRVTTIFDKETRPGKLKAVHARHEFTDVSLPGFTSRPEQYFGECEVQP